MRSLSPRPMRYSGAPGTRTSAGAAALPVEGEGRAEGAAAGSEAGTVEGVWARTVVANEARTAAAMSRRRRVMPSCGAKAMPTARRACGSARRARGGSATESIYPKAAFVCPTTAESLDHDLETLAHRGRGDRVDPRDFDRHRAEEVAEHAAQPGFASFAEGLADEAESHAAVLGE